MTTPAVPPAAPGPGGPLAALCRAAAAELSALGPAGAALVSIAGAAETLAAGRGLEALDDPGFALDLLLAVPPLPAGADSPAALVGRVVAFLRARADGAPAPAPAAAAPVRLADAIAEYEAGAFLRLSPNSQRTYRTWTRRVAAAYGERDPRAISSGDLADLLAAHCARTRAAAASTGRRTAAGRSGEITGVTALRHLWRYLGSKGYADAAVAGAVSKPPKPRTTRRRGFRRDEAALLRHLARSGRGRIDALLDECIVLLAERALLRRQEIVRLRICDVDLTALVLHVWGKGDEWRTIPITPGLAAFLRRYLASRRPARVPADVWTASTERLLRNPPTPADPDGTPVGRRRVENMLERFHTAAPALFADGMLCLHSFRHSGATYLDARYGRAYTRAALGHVSRNSPTDFYVHVSEDDLRAALTHYEQDLDEQPGSPPGPNAVAA